MEDENNQGKQEVELYRWEALEFGRSAPKSRFWYGVVLVLVLAFIGYSLYTAQWVRAAVGVMIGVVLGLMVGMKPRQFSHVLTESGVKVGSRVYPYKQFRAFGIVRSDEGSKLIVVPQQRLGQGLSLQLGGADVEKIRVIMARYLSEEEMEEDLVDRMNRWFRI